MANPNIIQATSIFGKTDVMAVSTAATSIVTAGANKVLRMNSLVVSNIDASSPVDISVSLRRSNVDYYIASAISVPATSSIVVIGKENPMYVNEGDSIRIIAGSAGDAHATCSYEEIG